MGGDPAFDDDLARRLPLPLAQLYRRAHNAKTPLDRHNAAYCFWEAALKLLGAAAVVAYAERGEPAPEISERLQNLARPALGHWWEFVRLLVPALADAGDEGFRAARDLVLGRAREDLPRAAGLDAALREALDGSSGARVTVRLSELFDRLVRYRNREIGHGAPGQREREFYDRMGRALLLGVAELLGRLDVLAGRRLVAVADVRRQSSGAWLVERFELTGESPRRLESLERHESEAASLPRPGRLYLQAPADATEPSPAWSLHPLVVFEHETAEVFFPNARRGRRRVEYLCYQPGRTVERDDLDAERRDLLARVLSIEVDGAQLEQWAAQSQAEEPPSPAPEGPPRRRLGEFELLSELGRGGMGVVYRAWQPSLGRQVALKCMLRSGDPKADARFNREIHALGRVEHPHLVKVYTSGVDADRWYYAMELVEGATLGAVCGRLQGLGSGASAVDLATWHATLSTACQAARSAERPLSTPDEHPRPDTDRPAPTLSEGLTPEQVVELLHEWFAEATRAIRRHGGVVDKFIGDAIMAVFGVPGSRDDAAADAVRAAIEMRDALASLNLRRRALAQREFQVGIGINTGEAVVGFIGSHLQQSFAAIGDVTNTASRLETATKDYPGCDILISQATEDVQRRLGVAETTFLGLAALKGKEQKVPVYQVIGPREPRAATNALSQSPV